MIPTHQRVFYKEHDKVSKITQRITGEYNRHQKNDFSPKTFFNCKNIYNPFIKKDTPLQSSNENTIFSLKAEEIKEKMFVNFGVEVNEYLIGSKIARNLCPYSGVVVAIYEVTLF